MKKKDRLRKLRAALVQYWDRGEEAPLALLEKVTALRRPDGRTLYQMLGSYQETFIREMKRVAAKHTGRIVADLRKNGRKAVAVTDAWFRKYRHRTDLTEEEARESLWRAGDLGQPAGVAYGDRGGPLAKIYELDLRLDAAAKAGA
jgi:hypothetical protein